MRGGIIFFVLQLLYFRTERATLGVRFFVCFTCSQTHQIQLRVTETVETLQTPTTNGQIHSDKHHENHKHKKHQRNQKKQRNPKNKETKKKQNNQRNHKKTKKPKKQQTQQKQRKQETKKTKKKPKQQNSRTPAKFMAHAENSGKLFLFGFLVLLQFPWSRCWFPSHCFLRAGSLRVVFPLCQLRGLTIACFRVVGYFTTSCNVGSTIPFV